MKKSTIAKSPSTEDLTPEQERIALKIRELVSPTLAPEDTEKLLTVENVVRFQRAVTHRYESSKNLEIDEFLGDKANAYILAKWLVKKYPEETRESVLSMIVAKFLSESKLAQYSKRLGLPALLIKPKAFKAYDKDYEDMFEATMGAFVIIGDATFGEGTGVVIVQGIMERIFEEEGIDPKKMRDYIDSVSMLKMATNVLYNTDPIYRVREYTITEPDGSITTWFGATVIRKVRKTIPAPTEASRGGYQGGRGGRFQGGGRGASLIEYEEDTLASLDKDNDELQKSKQQAKEAVARKALEKEGWDYDSIEEERRKKDAAVKEKLRQNLSRMIQELRGEVLEKLRREQSARSSMQRGAREQMLSDEKMLQDKYGVELAHQIHLPIEADFVAKKKEDDGDADIVFSTTNSAGELVARGAVREKPSQINNAYRRLIQTYIRTLREQFGLPPRERD